MFGLKHFKLVKELKNIKIDWIRFSSLINSNGNKSKILNSIIQDNKFVEEDLKIRAMVEEMLKKEFPKGFKNKETYDFIVDTTVNKLKQKQIGNISEIEEV